MKLKRHISFLKRGSDNDFFQSLLLKSLLTPLPMPYLTDRMKFLGAQWAIAL